jgi:hypothetical protein
LQQLLPALIPDCIRLRVHGLVEPRHDLRLGGKHIWSRRRLDEDGIVCILLQKSLQHRLPRPRWDRHCCFSWCLGVCLFSFCIVFHKLEAE